MRKTIKVAFKSSEYDNSPDELVFTGDKDDLSSIKRALKAMESVQDCLFSANIDVSIFSPEDDCDWRYDVSYVIAYVRQGVSTLFQYHQCKYDASSYIESDSFTMEDIENLIKKEENENS